ncbi:MAG: hypothetical protein IJ975_02050 [Clostridia bacterium]|nr:hypothetical protein [Clostridia bacterium]
MWEFSINLGTENSAVAKYIFNSLAKVVEDLGGVITSYEQSGKISIILACPRDDKPRLEYHIGNVVAQVISVFFKERFLERRLRLPKKSEIELFTFKKALISFDRETDRFLINKFLSFGQNLELESFFHFRLRALQEKWTELVGIANENSTYLLGEDSFVELLKFLVDNIEVAGDEMVVEIKHGHIDIFDTNGHILNGDISKFALVEKILEDSPRKICWISDQPDLFLEKVFAKRIVYN